MFTYGRTMAFVVLLAMACANTGAQETTPTAEALQQLLAQTEGPLIPELDEQTPAKLAETERGQRLLTWAQEADFTIPQTTYTLYREFQRTGDRRLFERPFMRKRELLTQAFLRVWLGEDEEAVPHLNDLIWDICEETTWVLPAHEEIHAPVDLFATETAASLAHISYLLPETLPSEIHERIAHEVNERIFVPYLESPNAYGWGDGGSNWTAVCASSIGEAALILEDDPARLAQMLEHVLAQNARYIQRAFTDDGASLEGIGYWNYGLMHLVIFADMMRAHTGGKINLFEQEKLHRIARYPQVAALEPGLFVSFADSSPRTALTPATAAKLAGVTGVDSLRALAGDFDSWRTDVVVRNLLWWDPQKSGAFELEDAWLKQAEIAKRVAHVGGVPITMVAKAGSNGEPHNNVDVGQFIYYANGEVFLCDPGSGLYTKDYFSRRRYENLFANAYGHALPVIGGHVQPPGGQYQGELTVEDDGTVMIDFTKAYNIPELELAIRRLHLAQDGTLTMTDTFRFNGDGLEVKEPLMTWLEPEVSGNVATLTADAGVVTIEAQGQELTLERLEEESKANRKPGILKRISATWPAAPEIEAQYVIRFRSN